ncbi:MotA/TolQ/ExbB proton channel family protein [Aquibium sp. A9E412]|uniref:MotA/TolQ/ExbB proton channel family protein n=1 Tax=Aquibium sp. A9E412 TaxID=2976767 RepID=UPI0025B0ADB3|nr:MotA/TolQ/ExbB proton channel family protein [Aquibium sp. A9E412]MDN2566935.1 MotA/TolQ/ExbB proton channel family protein [Aquibium sp. A9E412]
MTDRLADAVGNLFALGGPVVAILVLLSVFALAMILLKAGQFLRERVGAGGRTERALDAWAQRRDGEARALVERDPSPAGAALALVFARMGAADADRQAIEEEAARLATVRLHALQRGLRALDAIAQTAPLLGLFGTVLGMIDAFQALQSAGSVVDPSMLAGGIWVALLTTAVGLGVAMPVSLAVTVFETRIENERVAIETTTGAALARRPSATAVPGAAEAAAAPQREAAGHAA